MDLRQLELEKLVVEYFRTRQDTELSRAADGALLLRLTSAQSRDQFGGKDEVRLTCDPDQAFDHPDWQLINATHPYLDFIRNDLASDLTDPGLSEAHFAPQLLTPFGELKPPQVAIEGPVSEITAAVTYRPYYVLAYKAVFEADERQDYILRLCFDASTGARRDDVVPHLATLPLKNGPPPGASVADPLIDLSQVMKAGRSEVANRVSREVASIATEYAEQLASEKARLTQHYQSEIELSESTRRRDEEGRHRLQENLKKEIEDFERKYQCAARASLISVLLLWGPILRYQIGVASTRSRFRIDGFEYESCTDTIDAEVCPTCGGRERIRICCAGKHTVCGEEGCTVTETCKACRDSYCPAHGTNCARCHEPSCVEHHASCSYGSHAFGSVFCPECTRESFEAKAICKECAKKCSLCSRAFPSELMLTCAVGSESFCSRHDREPDGDICSECGKPVCKAHGGRTSDESWTCTQHSQAATCCGRVFGHSKLETCSEDSRELLCPDHRVACTVCKGAVCKTHVVRSWQGEPLCTKCSGNCVRCPPQPPRIHRRDRLYPCTICRDRACREHIQRCAVCEAVAFCTVHAGDLPSCESCGRVSCTAGKCSVKKSRCKLCGIEYCRHCMQGDDICETCARPAPLTRAGDVFALLENVAAGDDRVATTCAQAMLKSFGECSFAFSENRTYKVTLIHRKPSRWMFWQREATLRVITKRAGTVVRAYVER